MDNMTDPPTYVTEDGVTVSEGDRVYNYYDMRPGIIGKPAFDGTWFNFHADDKREGISTLNGARICSMGYARRRGFRDTEIEDV